MPTRLKQLDLHGFKSFATPTTFVFDPGITAIIGPNGSGKSNIADAVRWVLGEQSYSQLRGRKTEDVIFAGGSGRAPLGMAEVSLTLDNTSGELPLAYAEITVVRRAFRSGENQYLINGSRVRLKDILQITASLGQAYTVIGQGLVDAVLSQQPEDRRGLFEHAAGITGLRLKRVEAERGLNESQANTTRLEDLLGEIEPRLRSLERAARQAREYEEVAGKLAEARLALATYDYHAVSGKLQAATESLAASDSTIAELDREIEVASRQLESAEALAQASEEDLRSARREVNELEQRRRDAAHQLAIEQERLAAHRQRALDAERDRDQLGAGIVEVDTELAAAAEAEHEARCRLTEIVAELATAEQQVKEERRRRIEVTAELHAIEQRLDQTERESIAAEARRRALRQQQDDLQVELSRLNETAGSRQAELLALDADMERQCARRASLAAQIAANDHDSDRLNEEIAAARHGVDQHQQAVERLRLRLAEKEARREALSRLRDSGAGLQAGASTVLRAAGAGELQGIVGPIARLIEVPADLETAIEVALGGRLQDIVTEHWRDAEQAIELLKQRHAGRATFQPLDTVRSTHNRVPLTGRAGILGGAVDLIHFDPQIEPVMSSILGRTMVAESLAAARKALSNLPAGWTIVTVAGEIIRSSGSLTGGARVRESGTLARERELRQLPQECDRLRQEFKQATREHQRRLDDIARLDANRAKRRQTRSERLEANREVETALDRLAHRSQVLHQQASDDLRRHDTIADRMAANGAAITALDAKVDDLGRTIERLASRRSELSEVLSREFHQTQVDAVQELLAQRAAVEERMRQAGEQCRRLRKRQQDARASRSSLEERINRIAAESERARRAAENWQAQLKQLERSVQEASERVSALTASHQRAAKSLETAGAVRTNLTSRRQSLAAEHDRRWLAVERLQDELKLILERVAHDLGDDGDIEPRLTGADPVTSDEAARLEPRIERLRERLRRIGLVGEGAIETFEQESRRYQFLRGQFDDVQQAAGTLRLMLQELDRSLRQEFDQAFASVAAEFEAMFQKLFGGGKARLIQTREEGREAGIDILAQPPGKRLQNLSLLSGGERSLTAVALLFAIQKVNPSPFCLLDEVDAALDEANVVRLGEELRELAGNTQFVVITHNRATIEGADTLYGISIGADSVSRVLSLRLEHVAE